MDNKFDSTKLLGVYYWYVNTIRACGARIKMYYVLCSKTYVTFRNVLKSTASSRQAARSARICETRLFCVMLQPNVKSVTQCRGV